MIRFISQEIVTTSISTIVLAGILTGCGGGSTINVDNDFSSLPENQRLRYFKEIHMDNVRQRYDVNGEGIRVTIMGEEVDASHPDLIKRIHKQYNTFAEEGEVLAGTGNQAYGFNKMGLGDGHGTHIAGTIAAECDGEGVLGIACGATLDVYDIGAYDNTQLFNPKGWGGADDVARLFQAFNNAMQHVTQQAKSTITTGSFNFESPYIEYKPNSALQGISLTQLINQAETLGGFKKLAEQNKLTFKNTDDLFYLDRMANQSDEPIATYFGTLLPLTKEWADLENTIANYQSAGGVYLITESNQIFNRTSVINAFPTISNKVDKDLWLSVVLVAPPSAEVGDDDPSVKITDTALNGSYITPINSCGKIAKDYCILTPSYNVLSTMTEAVKEDSLNIYNLDQRKYQVFTGHSMGAPMVAATLALMQEYNQAHGSFYSKKDLVRIIKQSANRTFSGYDPEKHGQGILDVNAALKLMIATDLPQS